MSYRIALAVGVSFCILSGAAGIAACSSDDKDSGAADSGSAGSQCASSPTFFECQACCGITESYGQGQQALEDCLCDEACKTQCGSNACSPDASAPGATPDCEACLDSDQAAATCKPKAQAICDRDPACKQFQACALAAACGDKPDDVDGG